MIEVLDLADASVATSGDYVRFHDVERLYHPTVEPATGRSPVAIASVSVRARSAVEADALATAALVLGLEAGTGLLSRLGGVAGLARLANAPDSPKYNLIGRRRVLTHRLRSANMQHLQSSGALWGHS